METQTILGKIKGIIVLVVLLAAGLFVYQRYIARPTLITVSGEGVVEAVPSSARIIATIISNASSGQDAFRGGKQIQANIVASLLSKGVRNENIRTLSFTVTSAEAGQNRIYRAVGGIEVSLEDIKKVDEVVSSLLVLGAHDISSIVFTAKDSSLLEKQAVKKAVDNAKQRAKEIAKAQGKRLTRLVSISTSEQREVAALTTKGVSEGTAQIIEIRRNAVLVYELR